MSVIYVSQQPDTKRAAICLFQGGAPIENDIVPPHRYRHSLRRAHHHVYGPNRHVSGSSPEHGGSHLSCAPRLRQMDRPQDLCCSPQKDPWSAARGADRHAWARVEFNRPAPSLCEAVVRYELTQSHRSKRVRYSGTESPRPELAYWIWTSIFSLFQPRAFWESLSSWISSEKSRWTVPIQSYYLQKFNLKHIYTLFLVLTT